MTEEKTKTQQYEDAAITFAYHVVWHLEHNSKLSQLSLDAANAYRAARATWYAAIDAMVDKLDRQVRKHKEKISDHHQREGGIKQHTGDD